MSFLSPEGLAATASCARPDRAPGPPDASEILERLPDAILLLGNGRIIWANGMAEETFGAGRNLLVGSTLERFLGPGSALAALCASVGNTMPSLREGGFRLTGRPPLREGTYDLRISYHDGPDPTVLVSLRGEGLGEQLAGLNRNQGTARSLSALAATLAHEVRNPLSGIRGAAQLLERAVNEGERDLALLIAEEVDRVCALLDRMEALSEHHPMSRQRLNIHEVLDRVVRLSRVGAAAGLTIRERYDPSLPPVEGDRDALIQVFLNLVTNAAHACGPDGVITLSTMFDGSISRGDGLLPLVVTVADDGPGIPCDLMADLFAPFVSGSGTGTGLGLALVAAIVDGHGGVVTAESRPGATEFRVALPLAATGEPGP